jgi:transposase-like protein
MWWFLEAAVGFEIDRKLSGVVEADEIYVSAGHKGKKPAKVRNGSSPSRAPRHRGVRRGRGRGHAQKDRPVVVVKRQRKGPVCSSAAADVTDETVKRLFRERVAPGSTVYTDSAKCYRPLGGEGYTLEQVNHSRGEYARGEQNEIHENGAEGEISLLKPFLGVYRGVSQRNLPSYLLFYQFQRNHRDLSRWEQAAVLMAALLGNGPAPCCLLPPLWAHSFEECTVGCHTSSE